MKLEAVLLALFLGLTASAAETFSRHRDEPYKAVFGSVFGWAYLLLNGGLSVLVYWILLRSQESDPTELRSHLMLAAFAGLGAVAFFRTRLSFQVGTQKLAVDPGAVVDSLFDVLKEQISRARLSGKTTIVRDMRGLDFSQLAQLARVDVRGNPGLTIEKPSDVVQKIHDIENDEMSEDAKVRALGYVLLHHMGEDYVRGLVAEIQERSSAPSAEGEGKVSTPSEEQAVSASEFVRAGLRGVTLAEATSRFTILATTGSDLELEERYELLRELAQITARHMEEGDKALAIGFLVYDFFGQEVFGEHFPESC